MTEGSYTTVGEKGEGQFWSSLVIKKSNGSDEDAADELKNMREAGYPVMSI